MGILDKLKKTKEAEETVQTAANSLNETEKTVAAPKAAKKKATETKKEGSRASRAHAVLKKSHISEKAAHGETKSQYTFVVAKDADKESIKDAVEALYGVRPRRVRTQHIEGKDTSFGNRIGRRTDWKKAVVILPKGKTINTHEGV